MTPNRPKITHAPRHLGAAGRAVFRELALEYQIVDAGGLLLLTQAAICADRLQAARVAIAKDGELVVDRYGKPRCHPALALEKDARGQLLQAIKLLGLDIEPELAKKGDRR